MLSRDCTRPENNKLSLDTFCCELLNRTGLGQCVMQASTKLCLAFFGFFTVFENKRFFQLDPVPKAVLSHLDAFAFNYFTKAKHRSDVLIDLNIMQPVKQLRTHAKVLPFQKQAF